MIYDTSLLKFTPKNGIWQEPNPSSWLGQPAQDERTIYQRASISRLCQGGKPPSTSNNKSSDPGLISKFKFYSTYKSPDGEDNHITHPPADRPTGLTLKTNDGPCLSPASWSAIPLTESARLNVADLGENGFGSFCRNKRTSAAGPKPGKRQGPPP